MPIKPYWMYLLGLSAVVPLLNWDVTVSMVELWQGSAYEHCYLIPFVTAYILWRENEASQSLDWKGSLLGLIALLLSMIGLYAANVALIQLLEHVFVLLGTVAFVWAVAGTKVIVANWFAFAFLMLCLPVGDTLIPTLQKITADLSTAGLALFDIPAYREGMLITLPAGVFEVARACSGFRYLNAGIAVGALIAYLNFSRIFTIALYIGFVLIVFVLMNGIRAFLTILIAAYSNMEYMTGEDHIYFGYVLFVLALYFIYRTAQYMQKRELHA